ncbi:Glycosyltransferase involved in cell wall bisynthesis [Pustulibacterium marinum]|uniref:Glycosyltransferase involved in cell wall bisynthesis n=1 Tax=Pustulibacterium marinum TaxID=1224947 RepID=A0A1I7FTD8_9FLAO|nr:glycosyltransferase [Pustulibacterium marinum]SFU39276.1 Glycosyltransferase involved in cell wall bisynthesis [Pustulibacterium marinum]
MEIKKLLIIGFVWPEPNSSAAGSRMMQLIELFLENKYQVTFASSCAKTANAIDLATFGIHSESIALNDASFDVFVKALNPNVVLFDRFMTEEQFGWRVAENCPDALRVLDTEDLHSLRKGREEALKREEEFSKKYLFNDHAKREIASMYRCDLSLMISEFEMELLQETFKFPKELLMYLPFLLAETQRNHIPKFEDRQHFMTIGNFLHQPNFDGVQYLKAEIWPLIKQQLPKAEMHVFGAYKSQKVQQQHNEKDKFLIKGFADNVDEVMSNSKVCLAALRFGAGLKGKLFDAMLNGTPAVMTPIAAEGMFGNEQPNGFVAKTPSEFAEKAIQLYTDETVWKQAQENGFRVLANRFQKKQFQTAFSDMIEMLQTNLEQHRLDNFTGSMLMHHTLQSTKFMSRWIEAKNASAH